MLRYLAKRLAGFIPLLLGISFVSFMVMALAPGSPVDLMTDLNPKASPEARVQLEKYYGLDKPLYVQYGLWLGRVVKGDFGTSFSRDRRPVLDKIVEALPITLMLNVLEISLILLIAIPIGIHSAARQYSTSDRITTVLVFVGFASPDFWVALLAMTLFGAQLNLLPISGLASLDYDSMSLLGKIGDRAAHLILPVMMGAVTGLAGMSRYMRSSMLEVLRQDYVQTARAKGLEERVVLRRHALRNALMPVVTLLGLSIPGLIGGSVISETIFGIPGMGRLFFTGVMSRDYPVVMGILMIGAVLTLLGNLAADLLYVAVDPRLRKR
ncbi:MAG TPA: ABC transporter permease [Candidatus Limnocylindrales bacterium]|nr:ABC transporter permease [Candidatus Limnocylindrales bacterium]